jgi:hypothetical protein
MTPHSHIRHSSALFSSSQECNAWQLTKQQQDTIEQRMGNLVGIANWIPAANACFFKNTGRLKSVDWQRLTKGPGAYVFENILPSPQQAALEAVLAALSTQALEDLETKETTKMIERLCIFEKAVPTTVMHVQVHQLVHVPKCALKWNRVRNFWAFANERYQISFVSSLLFSSLLFSSLLFSSLLFS